MTAKRRVSAETNLVGEDAVDLGAGSNGAVVDSSACKGRYSEQSYPSGTSERPEQASAESKRCAEQTPSRSKRQTHSWYRREYFA